ncbi:MAG: diaminopropionate ammonia-lyase [Rhodanobacter sp.]
MFFNPHRSAYLPSDRDLIGRSHAEDARRLLELCPVYRATPLLPLCDLAAEFDLAGVYLKAEWSRMGLSSFKALGGAYAVALLVLDRARAALGRPVRPDELSSPSIRSIASGMTITCASAGNHGLAVVAGARAFGARAVVWLSDAVAERFAMMLRAQGATVLRGGSTYEQSMVLAQAQAEQQHWDLVSDSSWPGYTKVPLDVMRGYTVMLEEIADVMEATKGPATHVFVQAGVGGLAAAAVGYLRDRWGEGFRFVVAEPEAAPCLLESVRRGCPVRVKGSTTRLGRLDCKEPSLLAFDLLSRLADAFMLVSDADADDSARRLSAQGAPVSACGAAGAAGLIAVCANDAERQQLDLNANSRVLLIGTEAADNSIEGIRI